jgi:TldD protein
VSFSRRRFLGTTAAAAAVAWLPNRASALTGSAGGVEKTVIGGPPRNIDPDLHALAARAVDAARSAGASYADVRLTRQRTQQFFRPLPTREGERFAVGVRVLVNGYWGFLSSALWTPDEVVRLAQGAVQQAKANGRGKVRPVELAETPQVVQGKWVMPVKYDPFDIPIGEKLDVINAAEDFATSYMVGIGVHWTMNFEREEKVFASSEGSSWEQVTYNSAASFSVSYRSQYSLGLDGGGAGADFLGPAGRGWEHISESGLIEAIPELIDQAEQSRYVVPVDVDRLEAVFSAQAMASLLSATLGPATELDRAMGFEANASGTSFLSEPLEMLGTQKVAAPMVNITANRSVQHGLATVKWDDECVVPEDFTLVKDGVLVDYQTTREQAAWLKPYYERIQRPIRSHGCAGSESAMAITTQHIPNLAITPGSQDIGFEELVSGIKKGVAVLSLSVSSDQQHVNGFGQGVFREIVDGKLKRYITGAAFLFRTPEIWQNVLTLGGPKSQRMFGYRRGKGQPWQWSYHSVSAVPARIKQIDLIDAKRKA